MPAGRPTDFKPGIYKITSPTGRVYVGQSVDIGTRFAKYRTLHCRGQVRLFNSLVKHGVDRHAFEVLEYCDVGALNERERHYQDAFDVLSASGLNCTLTGAADAKGRHSDETRAKISKAKLGKRLSDQTRNKLKGRVVTEEVRAVLRAHNLGKKVSEETREKQRKRMTGNTYTKGVRPPNARRVFCSVTGRTFLRVSDAATAIGVKTTTLGAMLRGQNANWTSMGYL